MSDLARWELRGPVRTLRTQFAEWNPETGDWWPLKNRFVAMFRRDGQLKTPLPPDFTVTYDLVASANYTWGARGMTFTLSNGAGAGFRGPSSACGLLFDQLSLNHGGTFNANDRMFIGNLTILKK